MRDWELGSLSFSTQNPLLQKRGSKSTFDTTGGPKGAKEPVSRELTSTPTGCCCGFRKGFCWVSGNAPKFKKKTGATEMSQWPFIAELGRKERKGYPIMLGDFCNKENKLYLCLDLKLENRTAWWGLLNWSQYINSLLQVILHMQPVCSGKAHHSQRPLTWHLQMASHCLRTEAKIFTWPTRPAYSGPSFLFSFIFCPSSLLTLSSSLTGLLGFPQRHQLDIDSAHVALSAWVKMGDIWIVRPIICGGQMIWLDWFGQVT